VSKKSLKNKCTANPDVGKIMPILVTFKGDFFLITKYAEPTVWIRLREMSDYSYIIPHHSCQTVHIKWDDLRKYTNLSVNVKGLKMFYFKNHLTCWKIKIYKIIILFGCETWSLAFGEKYLDLRRRKRRLQK
jgi:hypothetical protein